MSSPITFSGFNNIDFNTVLNSLMAQASQPLTALQNQQQDLKTQVSNFGALNGTLSTLRSAADALSTPAGVNTLAGTSSDAAVGVNVDATATAAHYDVVVTSLARSQVTASTSTTADATNTVVANGGTITIGGVDVTVTGSVTLQQLADTINSTAGIGVTAGVVRTGTNAYKLALTANASGLANAFTVTNNLTGGAGVTFGSTNAVDASDAAITLNNIPVTNSSNTFANVMPGVTLTVTQKDPTKVVSVDVASDPNALTAKVNAFVTAYNGVVSYINSQRSLASGGDTGSIGRDPLLRQVRNSLRNELLNVHSSGTFSRLTQVGIEFQTDGTLSLDPTKFSAAITADGAGVQQLFAGATGAFPAIEGVLDSYSQSSGIISSVQNRLNQQITSMDDQISQMQARLATQRASLQVEFTQADAAMSQLKNQSGSLANLGTSGSTPSSTA